MLHFTSVNRLIYLVVLLLFFLHRKQETTESSALESSPVSTKNDRSVNIERVLNTGTRVFVLSRQI